MRLSDEPDEAKQRAVLDALYGEMKGVRRHTKPRRKKPKMDHKRKGPKGRTSPVQDYVRNLGEDYKTTQEVADALGISANYVRKLAKDDRFKAPSYVAPFGNKKVYLYTPEDVKELREYLKGQHKVYKRADYERKEAQGG